MNGNTHFLDHSNVYGSDDATAIELRTFVKGGLKVNHQNPHLDLLPPDNTTETNCTLSKPVSGVALPVKVKCFKAGTIFITE
jgi:peroxidase